MIQANLNWNDGAANQVLAAGWNGIRAASTFFHRQVTQALNVPNTGTRRRRVRDTSRRGGGPKGSSYTVYDHPSKPGEPPHKITGNLQRAVQIEYDQPALAARVGVTKNAKYGARLELKMARSFMMSTLKKVWQQLAALAVGGGGS